MIPALSTFVLLQAFVFGPKFSWRPPGSVRLNYTLLISDSSVVDIVYFWANTTDPDWIRRRDATMKQFRRHWGAGLMMRRYRESRELLWALRSQDKYAPWIRHTFIATNNHQPSWLVDSHPDLTFVDQSALLGFPPENYNVEMFRYGVVNITGLSNYFILASDDHFFTQPVTRSDFFTRSGDVIGQGGRLQNCSNFMNRGMRCSNSQTLRIMITAQFLSDKLVCERFGLTAIPRFNTHIHMPVNLRLLREMIEDVDWSFMKKRRVRTCGDLHFGELVMTYAWARGRAVTGPGITRILWMGGGLAGALRNGTKLTCVNVFPRGGARILSRYFPHKSRFER
jgi:hypothetical protein